MMTPERVVFDCNVFFQALTSPHGPARRLLGLAASKALDLYASEYSLAELSDVAVRPHLATKYGLNETLVDEFVADIRSFATLLDSIPHVFDFPRDPKDAHYVDLAVAAQAKLIVSRDKDLLSLRDAATPEGRDFQKRFPGLSVLTPPELLAIIVR
jgi:uncharacterized protein